MFALLSQKFRQFSSFYFQLLFHCVIEQISSYIVITQYEKIAQHVMLSECTILYRSTLLNCR